ncbi:MAG: DegV family protein [Chloroflexi bacterium]|nr:DegV family protein [Chloroflexota bacterium]
MSNVAIVTDSTTSLPNEIFQSLDIHWVPYYIHREKETLRDLVTVQRDEFYQWLPTATVLPRTACPGPGDYAEVYERLAHTGVCEIASIHMTSKGSGAFQAATIAKDMLQAKIPHVRIRVIDTLNTSLCHGWMVIEAARAARQGKALDDVVQIAEKMIPITRMIQTADTLKYLYMGGRIGKAKHLVGTLLNIKPLIGMEQGVIVPLGQARSRHQAYEAMVDLIESAVGKKGAIKIAYVHAAAIEEAKKIQALVEQRFVCVESFIAELSPALGVHTGPGTAGVCYFPV